MPPRKPRADEHRMISEARKLGAEARAAGKGRDNCPPYANDYPVKGLRDAWLDGWESSCPRERVPEIRTPAPAVETLPGTFLPANEKMPETYPRPPRREPIPCQFCRAILLPDKAQAVIVRAISGGFAFLLCRSCGETFKRRLSDS